MYDNTPMSESTVLKVGPRKVCVLQVNRPYVTRPSRCSQRSSKVERILRQNDACTREIALTVVIISTRRQYHIRNGVQRMSRQSQHGITM